MPRQGPDGEKTGLERLDSTPAGGWGKVSAMRNLLRTIKRWGGRSISAALLILGLLYVWPDIQGLAPAYGYKWGQLVPDRETVAYVLLAGALLWIIWIDVRPSVLRHRRMFECLRIRRFELAELIRDPATGRAGLRLRAFIENQSKDQRIYFKIEQAFLFVDGHVNQDSQTISVIDSVLPGR